MKPFTATRICSASSSVYLFSTCIVALRQGFFTESSDACSASNVSRSAFVDALDFGHLLSMRFPIAFRMDPQFLCAGLSGSGIPRHRATQQSQSPTPASNETPTQCTFQALYISQLRRFRRRRPGTWIEQRRQIAARPVRRVLFFDLQ